jgi:hypothetical protein
MTANAKQQVLPSGPPKYLILGHLPDFLRDKLGLPSHCAALSGDVVQLRIGEPMMALRPKNGILMPVQQCDLCSLTSRSIE